MAHSNEPASWFAPPDDGLLEDDDYAVDQGVESTGCSDRGEGFEEAPEGVAWEEPQAPDHEQGEGGWALESVEPEEAGRPREQSRPLAAQTSEEPREPRAAPRPRDIGDDAPFVGGRLGGSRGLAEMDEPAWALGSQQTARPCPEEPAVERDVIEAPFEEHDEPEWAGSVEGGAVHEERDAAAIGSRDEGSPDVAADAREEPGPADPMGLADTYVGARRSGAEVSREVERDELDARGSDEHEWLSPEEVQSDDPSWCDDDDHYDDEACSALDHEAVDEYESRASGGLDEHVEDSPRVVRAKVAAPSARGLSWLVDGALIVGGVTLLVWIGGLISGTGAALSLVFTEVSVALPVTLVAALGGAVYTAASVALMGRTVGGMVAGVRILDGRGETPDPLRASKRGLAAAGGVLLLGFGLAWLLLDDKGQALHDRLTATFSVED